METQNVVPKRAGLVLTTLVLGALVANLNLSVANIALPDIARAFDAAQTQVNLIAVGCTLGLAMSVLYLGAIGDRYGRKLLLLLGMALTVPASLLSAYSTDPTLLIGARVFTGLAAGMAYPTTLALITALWGPGKARVKAIALWSSVGGGGAIIGPVIAGAMLEQWWWGSVFLIALPPAIIVFFLVWFFVPAHVQESTEKIDHPSGVLSVIMVALLVLGLGSISAPGFFVPSLIAIAVSLLLVLLFGWRQLKVKFPLYDLALAKRVTFWVPSIAGAIVFGSMMGAMFIGQQFLQNVLQYSTLEAGVAILPAAVGMMGVAQISAKLLNTRGGRFTMLAGFISVLIGFLIMLTAWTLNNSYLPVGLAYLFVGAGAGLALTPASRSLTNSVPVPKVGMASATTDLQRDLGGSIMQALLGSLLTAGYAHAFMSSISSSPSSEQVSAATQTMLTKSFAGAQSVAASNPQYADNILSAARESFLTGSNWAYFMACAFVVIGAVIVATRYPNKQHENELFAQYAGE